MSFWVELKVHRLKSLKSIKLSPHQIAWQTRYCRNGGIVKNLVAHPSSSTLNIFCGSRAIEIAGADFESHGPCSPDWSSTTPFDWHGVIDYILSSSPTRTNDQGLSSSQTLPLKEREILANPRSLSLVKTQRSLRMKEDDNDK